VFNYFYDCCHVRFAANTNKLLKTLNPDFFVTLCELNGNANLNGCELNLDFTVHMCLPTQSKKLLAFY